MSIEKIRALLPEISAGKNSAIAIAISAIEDGEISREDLKTELGFQNFPHVLGITGSPGVGKSTTTSALINKYLAEDKKVAVLAVDPSSPITGGALLGDRIRLTEHYENPNVFIRSLATRGALGGLSNAVPAIFPLLGFAGFDAIIVETVGVGQNEIEIMKYADTVLIVLSPAIGDDVQAAKAGIMEIGDIYLVNKSDLAGADKTITEIEKSLALSPKKNNWNQIVVKGAMGTAERSGLDDLWGAINKHINEVGLRSR